MAEWNTMWSYAAFTAGLGGVGMGTWAAISPSSQIFGPTLYRTGSLRSVALTFDDGPNPAVTPHLLDLLDRYQVSATFFMIGRYVRSSPALAAEVSARGHALGNHTDTHANLLWLSPARIGEQLDRCQQAIQQATGRSPRWMRPPWGFRGPQLWRVVHDGGWDGVAMWTRMAFDWKPQPPEPMIRRLARARGGEILLMHDGDPFIDRGDREHVLLALEHWLPRWVDAGFEFVTIEDVAGEAPAVDFAG